jgi:hypothetical protein
MKKLSKAIACAMIIHVCPVLAQQNTTFEWEAKTTYILESLEIAHRKCWSNPLSKSDYDKLSPVLTRSVASHLTHLTAASARNKFIKYGQEYCNWASNNFQSFAKELN